MAHTCIPFLGEYPLLCRACIMQYRLLLQVEVSRVSEKSGLREILTNLALCNQVLENKVPLFTHLIVTLFTNH